MLLVQRQTSATQYDNINAYEMLPLISIALPDNSFDQISVNRSLNILLGDCHSKPAPFELVTAP
jgi:hypothetical protein